MISGEVIVICDTMIRAVNLYYEVMDKLHDDVISNNKRTLYIRFKNCSVRFTTQYTYAKCYAHGFRGTLCGEDAFREKFLDIKED